MADNKSPGAEFSEISPTAYSVKIVVPADTYKRVMDGKYRELAKDANIPGFRPGKAPRNILNRHFGVENVLKEVVSDVIEQTFWPQIEKKEFMVVGSPRIETGKFEEGKDFEYAAVFEIVPPIPVLNYEDLKVYLPTREVKEERVEEEIRNLSIRMGESEEIKGREAGKGDYAVVELEGEVPDVIVDTLTSDTPWKYHEHDMLIELGAGKAIAGLEDKIIGMELEEIKEFELDLPDDFGDPRVRGKKMNTRVRLKALNEIKLAEITDDFLKERMGQSIENIDQLRDRIREEITSNNSQMDKQAITDQVELLLARMDTFPLPEGIVRSEFATVLDKALEDLIERGLDVDGLMDKDNETGQRVRKKARFQAERIARLSLIMAEVSRKESIQVSDDEVLNYIALIAYRSGINQKDLKQWIQDRNFIERTREDLLRKKVTHFLNEKVKTETVETDEFVRMMEQLRTENEELEKKFMKSAKDPLEEMDGDYLPAPGLGDSSESAEDEEEEKAEEVLQEG
ncbi:MAG TPA: trigger factor [bacterium]|jgi:trigger factor